MNEAEVLTIQPIQPIKRKWKKNQSCWRDKKIERKFQKEVINLFHKYERYPMLAVQNCQFGIEKMKGGKDLLLNLPDGTTCFYICRNHLLSRSYNKNPK